MSTLTWIDAAGTATVLDSTSGFAVLFGAIGLDVPPVELNTAPYLSSDGSVLVKRRRGHRRIALPMYFNTAGTATAAVGQAAAFFQGPGTLRVEGDHIRDLLAVVYEAGMEGDWSDSLAPHEAWRKLVVGLLALDPWWYGLASTATISFGGVITFDSASTAFDAVVPFDGEDATPIVVAGDADAAPLVTIRGPFSALSVGLAGGQTFTLAAALADGDTITVDTAVGARGPSRNGGAVDWSLLTSASRLWGLPVGSSVLTVAATGDGANSLIEVSWRERWLTP